MRFAYAIAYVEDPERTAGFWESLRPQDTLRRRSDAWLAHHYFPEPTHQQLRFESCPEARCL